MVHPASPPPPDSRPGLPPAPALVAGFSEAVWLTPDGEVEHLDRLEVQRRTAKQPPLLCHAPASARRVGLERIEAYDLLELFAFVRPARTAAPTPRGLAAVLGLPAPHSLEEQALTLPRAAEALLTELAAQEAKARRQAAAVAWTMARGGWLWGPYVLAALGYGRDQQIGGTDGNRGFAVWEQLGQWSEHAPEPPPGQLSVSPEEARERLSEMLGEDAEPRRQQSDYAASAAEVFQPREAPDRPRALLAEAGTGVGKTLGYLAPASLWAEKNDGSVWISTFTRNLQQQIDGELDRLYPDAATKARRVVVRKGRENYLCLLNYEEAVAQLPARPQEVVAVGLMARWAAATRDGDMVGGDFPGWLPDLAGRARTLGLTDRRGECIYSACPHYSRCYIEKSVRRARRARIVIANHALVMVQAALGGGDEGRLPTRYVFDEGHHLFDAADSAFAAHLTGLETRELRRWLLGADASGRTAGRLRGLKRRVEDLIVDRPEDLEWLEEALRAARALPANGWHKRVLEGQPQGPLEGFLAALRTQVFARSERVGDPYSVECEPYPLNPDVAVAAERLRDALAELERPLTQIAKRLAQRLGEEEADELESEARRRIDSLVRSLERRCLLPLSAWGSLLENLLEGETPGAFVDSFLVERIEGRELDMGAHRHFIDPTAPLAEAVYKKAHGLMVTSATLTDGSGEVEEDWRAAEQRSGTIHLEEAAWRAQMPSPFDYPAQTKVFIVNDVRKDDLIQVSAAYRALFKASGGGALGLFTAISRLKAVQQKIAAELEEAGLPLYAQHVDRLDTSTLVEIFRAEADSCLLGTDAVRDGVDVPGRALRLIVFDRVPWPRPSLVHRARREHFGKKRYDDMLTRLRLKQAFGRLVRRAEDHGVFVLLDPMMPSRLLGAFPEGVEVRRCGLAEAVAETRDFLTGY
ncbi:MAG: ATP-dependent DNA helicase [Limibacillus sp.]